MTIEVEGVKLYLQFKILVQEKEVKYGCTISKCSRDRKKHKKIKGRKRDYSKGTSENLWL